MITLHIILGLLSVITASLALKTKRTLYTSGGYGALTGTIGSGFYLVLFSNASLVRVCVTGTILTVVCVVMLSSARRQANNITQLLTD